MFAQASDTLQSTQHYGNWGVRMLLRSNLIPQVEQRILLHISGCAPVRFHQVSHTPCLAGQLRARHH